MRLQRLQQQTLHWSFMLERALNKFRRRCSLPYYTKDWSTHGIKLWEHHLGGLRDKPDIHLLEIGSFEGRSACWFLENIVTHPTSSITCVDLFRSAYEVTFDYNLARQKSAAQVFKIKGDSRHVLRHWRPHTFDVIYVDGGHRAAETWADGLTAWGLIKIGGIIIFDDYLWERTQPALERPQKAIDVFLAYFADKLEVLHHDYQVIVRRTV